MPVCYVYMYTCTDIDIYTQKYTYNKCICNTKYICVLANIMCEVLVAALIALVMRNSEWESLHCPPSVSCCDPTTPAKSYSATPDVGVDRITGGFRVKVRDALDART